jgi:hypothetical protein
MVEAVTVLVYFEGCYVERLPMVDTLVNISNTQTSLIIISAIGVIYMPRAIGRRTDDSLHLERRD